MAEVKYNPHHAGATPEARIANRLRNSGSPDADVCVQKGEGPTRCITNLHPSGTAARHGKVDTGRR
jgi:hypothetical protein